MHDRDYLVASSQQVRFPQDTFELHRFVVRRVWARLHALGQLAVLYSRSSGLGDYRRGAADSAVLSSDLVPLRPFYLLPFRTHVPRVAQPSLFRADPASFSSIHAHD